MVKFRRNLGAFSFYAYVLIAILIANWATQFEVRTGLDTAAPWVITIAVAVIGWINAGLCWKTTVELGLPRFFFRWPRWMLFPVSVVAIMTVAFYGVVVFLPDWSRFEVLMMLAVIPVIPASQLAYLHLRREFDEELEHC